MVATVRELNGSGTGGGSATGCTAVRMYWVRPYRESFSWAVSQVEQFDPLTQQPYGGRLLLPGTRLYAKTFDVRPLGKPSVGSDGNITYDQGSRVTINFETRQGSSNGRDQGIGGGQQQQAPGGPRDPANIPYMREHVSFSKEVVVVRKLDENAAPAWKWKSDNAPIAAEDGVHLFKLVSRAEWTLTKLYVPPSQYDRKTIMDAEGKVNAAAVCGLAAGTLMFNGAEVNREYQVGAATYYEIQYSFSYHSKGWNRMFRGGTAGDGTGWDLVGDIVGGKVIYEDFDIGTLIPEMA